MMRNPFIAVATLLVSPSRRPRSSPSLATSGATSTFPLASVTTSPEARRPKAASRAAFVRPRPWSLADDLRARIAAWLLAGRVRAAGVGWVREPVGTRTGRSCSLDASGGLGTGYYEETTRGLGRLLSSPALRSREPHTPVRLAAFMAARSAPSTDAGAAGVVAGNCRYGCTTRGRIGSRRSGGYAWRMSDRGDRFEHP